MSVYFYFREGTSDALIGQKDTKGFGSWWCEQDIRFYETNNAKLTRHH